MNPGGHFETLVLAAEGYIELGMPLDAHAQPEEIDPDQRSHTEVLALRVRIYGALKKWDLMRTVAKRLALIEPDVPQWTVSWAYSTRRTDSIDAARIILVNAVERQPDVAIYHYNLACYESRLGNLDEAKARLKRAFELEPKYRLQALEDEDLEPLWSSL
jgi:tetratricopeptide (TPR) repeat protein